MNEAATQEFLSSEQLILRGEEGMQTSLETG